MLDIKNEPTLKDGEPCSHPGCLSHVSHPCEGCGRVGGHKVDDWNHYLRAHITSEQYVANGGSAETLFEDLTHLWGNPSREDYLTKKEIRKIARRLARQLS